MKLSITESFRHLENRVRRALAIRGFADLLLIFGATALASFFLDWGFEMPWIVRLGVLIGVVTLYVRVLIKGRRRLQAGVGPSQLLATVENYDPKLEGSS